jgi:hypothetical protein
MRGIVTFKNTGRFGNFIFQMCTAMAYAWDHGLQYSSPPQPRDQMNKKWNPVYYDQYHLRDPKSDCIHLQELNLFKYDELPYEEGWGDKDIVLHGYFQNFKYFEKYRERLIDVLSMPKVVARDDVVSVHVRRGDYLTIPDKHIVPNKDWYIMAMDRFFPGREFLFFSDDIQWCLDNFSNRKDCKFVLGNTELMDFMDIVGCSDHINSSSTFSLTAAWFSPNPNKKVVTPNKWMTPRASNEWTKELIPDKWIKLACV